MKKILCFVLVLCLFGCTKTEEPITNVCQGTNGQVTFVSVDGKVQSMSEVDEYTFDALGVSASFLEKEDNQKQMLSNYQAMYQGITQGLDIQMEILETKVVFTITIDFTTADFSELQKAGIVASSDKEMIDLEKTIQQMQLTCN